MVQKSIHSAERITFGKFSNHFWVISFITHMIQMNNTTITYPEE